MLKISNKEIIDVVKYSDDKAIIVEKKPLGDLAQYKANYFVLNFNNGNKEVITKNAYLMKKFGSSFEKISDTIANYVQCDASILPNRNCIIVFPNGQAGLFDNEGTVKWNGELIYNESPVSGLAVDDNYFWSCCTEQNCVIRYSADNIKVDIRIGGKNANTFIRPTFVSADDKYIYVCCDNIKVRKIDKNNFSVSDIDKNYVNLKKFYKYGRFSIVCTSDGAYIDKD